MTGVQRARSLLEVKRYALAAFYRNTPVNAHPSRQVARRARRKQAKAAVAAARKEALKNRRKKVATAS